MQGYSLGTQLGILLPYSRTQETEADKVGLILMAKAGYDPAQALEFWKRMMTKDKKGVKMPEFMSTHPNDATRLRELADFLPEARKYYTPAHAAPSPPPPGPRAATPPSAPHATSPAPVAGRWIPAPR
jgi:predicted Zn-dependent protease